MVGADTRDAARSGTVDAASASARPAEASVSGGIGGHVRHLRHAVGLTQRQLAEPRYTRAYVAAVEAGTRTPSEEALSYFAGRLGADVDDLRHGRPPGVEPGLTADLAQGRRRLSAGDADAEAALAEVRARAERYSLAHIACWARFFVAEARLHRGEIQVAAAEFDRIAPLVPEGHAALAATVLARQSYCLLVGGDAARAVAVLETGLRDVRSAPPVDPDAELRLVNGLMFAFLELGWRQRARSLESEATALLPRVTRPDWVAQFHAIAAQLRRDGELAEVEHHVDEAMRIYTGLGLIREIALCHWARGYVLRRAGRPAEAAAELDKARTILGEVGAVQDLAGATLELAEVRRREGALGEAETLVVQAAPVCERSLHREAIAEADRILGLIRAQQGELRDAERLLRRAADRYEQAGLMFDVVITCRHLGDLLLDKGDRRAAAEVLRRGLRAAERLR